MRKIVVLGVASFMALSSTAASAATLVISADSVVDAVKGATGVNAPAGRDNPDAALGDADGAFYSMGLGGFIVFDFSDAFAGHASAFEITLSCTTPSGGAGCSSFPESVEILAGSGWSQGAGDVADLRAAFGPAQGEVFNNVTGVGTVILEGGPFTQLALIDTTINNFANDPDSGLNAPLADGFDVDAVRVAPIPVPAALPLLASALAVFGLLGRRRAA